MVAVAAVARVKRLRMLESCILMDRCDVSWVGLVGVGDYSIDQEQEDLVVLRSSCR